MGVRPAHVGGREASQNPGPAACSCSGAAPTLAPTPRPAACRVEVAKPNMDLLQAAPVGASSPPLIPAAARGRAALICFSHLRWDFVQQRPQHLMVRAARTYDVVFFEEPVFADVTAPRLVRSVVADGITVAVPTLPASQRNETHTGALHALLRGLLDTVAAERRIFWYCTPMARAFSRGFASDVTVYDIIDEITALRHAPPDLPLLEQALFARCDVVFCGGRSLYEAKRHRHPNVHAFPSSVDRVHFARARSAPPEPRDLAALAHPRLGFFGLIDERLDLDLLDRATSESPNWQWIMVGPVTTIDPAALPRRPNLHWLGERSYQVLPAYLAHWDLGVMPFALNDATRFISPAKTPEFLAAGLPVVSTPIHDIVRPYGELGLVAIAAGWEQFLSEARQLLWRPRDAWLEDVDRFLAGMSWDGTWDHMEALIRRALDRGDAAARVQLKSRSGVPPVTM
jgi:glycosyltransferase involved in cell wall biosynthesis